MTALYRLLLIRTATLGMTSPLDGQKTLTPAEAQLARDAGIEPAIALLLLGHGRDLRRLGSPDFGSFEPTPAPGLTVVADEEEALIAVHELREQVPPGHLVFRSGRRLDHVAVLRADDPYAPLRVMSTNGANYGLYTDEVIARLREWDARYGVRITGAWGDWVEAGFVRPPPDMLAFAREVYDFCPDVVDQGTETVEALAEEMRRSSTVFLWWD